MPVVPFLSYSEPSQPWIALILFVTLASYIPVTFVFSEWRTNIRRTVNQLDNKRSARVTDALINYETVAYFTNEVRRHNPLHA